MRCGSSAMFGPDDLYRSLWRVRRQAKGWAREPVGVAIRTLSRRIQMPISHHISKARPAPG